MPKSFSFRLEVSEAPASWEELICMENIRARRVQHIFPCIAKLGPLSVARDVPGSGHRPMLVLAAGHVDVKANDHESRVRELCALNLVARDAIGMLRHDPESGVRFEGVVTLCKSATY